MKRKIAFLLISMAFLGLAMQSCVSTRQPKCPGMYSQAEPAPKAPTSK